VADLALTIIRLTPGIGTLPGESSKATFRPANNRYFAAELSGLILPLLS
jgi:hypothetical protein